MALPLIALGGGLGLLKGLFGHHEESKKHDAEYGAYMNSFNQKMTNENSRRAILGALATSMGVGKLLPQAGAGSLEDFIHGFHPTALTKDQYTGPQRSLFSSALGGAVGGAAEAYKMEHAADTGNGGEGTGVDTAPKAGGMDDPFAGSGPQLPGVGDAAHGVFGGGGGGGAAPPPAPSPFGQVGNSDLSSLLKLPLPK